MSSDVVIRKRGRPKKTVNKDSHLIVENEQSDIKTVENTKKSRARQAERRDQSLEDATASTNARKTTRKINNDGNETGNIPKPTARTKAVKNSGNIPRPNTILESVSNSPKAIERDTYTEGVGSGTTTITSPRSELDMTKLEQAVQGITDDIQDYQNQVTKTYVTLRNKQTTPKPLSQIGLQLHQEPKIQEDRNASSNRQSRQLEIVDLLIQNKRKQLIASVDARINHQIKDRILTGLQINDLRMTNVAGEIVSIATGMANRQASIEFANQSALPPTSPLSSLPSQQKSIPSTPTFKTTGMSANISASTRSSPQGSKVSPQTDHSQPAPLHVNIPKRIPLTPVNLNPKQFASPAPKKPTQMTYEELKKHPDFKRKSRSWIGLIVGIPVLTATSWALWKDYDKRMMERKIGLHGPKG